MPTSSSSISVVIPTRRGERHLAGLLPTIRNQSLQPDEIIIVEDGPSDKATEKLLSGQKSIKYIFVGLGEHRGFAAAANAGIKVSSGDLITLINNDVKLDPRFFQSLSTEAESRPHVQFFATKIISMSDRDMLESSGDVLPITLRPRHRGDGANSGVEFNGEILGAAAAAAAYRREFFDTVGLFDEAFGSYLEDVDLTLRARIMGLKCSYVPNAVAYHVGAATDPSGQNADQGYDAGWRVRLIAQNRLFLVFGNLPGRLIFRIAPWLCWGLIRSFAYHAFISGSVGAYLGGLARAVKDLGKMKEKRRSLMSKRVISDSEIIRLFRKDWDGG